MKKTIKINENSIIVIIIFIIFFAVILTKTNEPSIKEAEKITAMILDEHDISFANNGIIDKNKLKEVKSMSYNDLKQMLNIKSDFCIYLEDSNGNILLAKGSSSLSEDGIYCSE